LGSIYNELSTQNWPACLPARIRPSGTMAASPRRTRSCLLVVLWAGLQPTWSVSRPSPSFVAAPPRGAGRALTEASRRPARVVSHARGGTRGGDEAASDGPNGILLAIGAALGLYGVFLFNYGWLDCTGGNYSPSSVAKCTLLDTLFGVDDISFQVRCKLKLIDACKDLP